MANFCSDNVAGVLPEIINALSHAARSGPTPSYGEDPWTEALTTRLASLFECPVKVFPVVTGTAANALALSALCPPWGAVYCHADSHVMEDECGAPEFYGGGLKLTGLPGAHGRIDPDALAESIAHYPFGFVHMVQPSALTLTNSTESGTLYTPDAIARLAEIARGKGLPVHLDGARFAQAMAALGCTPAEATWKAGVQLLSLGASKSGAMAAEALIVFNPDDCGLPGLDSLGYRRKRGGHLLSKMRFLSAQLSAWLEDDRWLGAGRAANAAAARLAQGIEAMATDDGDRPVRILHPVDTNMVFLSLPEPVRTALTQAGHGFYSWPPDGPDAIRLVCSHETTEADVDGFLADLRTQF